MNKTKQGKGTRAASIGLVFAALTLFATAPASAADSGDIVVPAPEVDDGRELGCILLYCTWYEFHSWSQGCPIVSTGPGYAGFWQGQENTGWEYKCWYTGIGSP
jgi:hypothetical protein